jgi:DNA-directed RNA polymerase delta subunit
MNNSNDSLIEIALREMKSKRRPRTLAKITKDVFEVKGINPKEANDLLTQFQMDFMLSGYFICCGEDKHGAKIWDLKNRQPSSLLDKDGSYLEDLYDYDDEVIKHELKDDIVFDIEPGLEDDEGDDDDLDTEEETDDIEEELYGRAEEEEDEEVDVDVDLLDDEDLDEEDDED